MDDTTTDNVHAQHRISKHADSSQTCGGIEAGYLHPLRLTTPMEVMG